MERCKLTKVKNLPLHNLSFKQNRSNILAKTVAHHFFNTDDLLAHKEEPGM